MTAPAHKHDDEIVYEAAGRRPVVGAIRDLVAYREVVTTFAVRAVRVRYKQMALGIAWALLQPLAFLLLFVVLFDHIAKLGSGDVPYAASALAALVGWQFVTNVVAFGANSLVGEAAILRKVYFPREAPVLGAFLAAFVDLALALGLFLVLGPVLGARFGVGIVALPLLILLTALPALAVALPLAAFNVYYRDLRYALPIFTQLLLLATPVAYPLSRVPARWHTAYALANPFVGPIEGLRSVLAFGDFPRWRPIGLGLVTTVVLLVAGYAVFRRLESEFADVV